MSPRRKGSTMSNNSVVLYERVTLHVDNNYSKKMKKLMEKLKKLEEMATSTLAMMEKMKKKFEENMGVLEAENNSLKTWFIDLVNLARNSIKVTGEVALNGGN